MFIILLIFISSLAPSSINATIRSIIPGAYYMNKGYNMLSGREIFGQFGRDIIDYQFDNIYVAQQTSDGIHYEIPLEFTSIPNIAPSCDISTNVNNVFYSSSSSVLEEQSKSRSGGYEQNVDLTLGISYGPISAEAKTSYTNSLLFGRSSTSISGQSQAKSGNTWSFSLESKSTLYQSSIDWTSPDDGNNIKFNFKSSFITDIISLNRTTTNKTILSFFNKWGTHVLSSMEAGSYCKETAYSESFASESQVHDFKKYVSSNSASFLFFKFGSDKTSIQQQSGSSNNGFNYEFSDIYCVGEVAVTSVCGGLTGTTNNPVVTSYKILPIWKIQQISDTYLSDDAIESISLFFENLYIAMDECAKNKCNDKGTCSLNTDIWSNTFIDIEWNGNGFDQLIDDDDDDDDDFYCFCNDGYYGNNCQLTSNCECFGDEDCCCKESNVCNNNNGIDLICSPINNRCIASNPDTECAKHGEFIQCEQGVMTGACGSGGGDDCAEYSGKCPLYSFNGIICDYQELGNREITDDWTCSLSGVRQSCQNNPNGDLLIGICGSGSGKDCQQFCYGYSGVLCSNIDGVKVNHNECIWYSQYNYGIFKECPLGSVMTGYCGSAGGRSCNGNVFEIQCCKLSYQ